MFSALERQHAAVLRSDKIGMPCPLTLALFNTNNTLVYKTQQTKPEPCQGDETHWCTTVFDNFSGVHGDGLTAEQAELVGRLGGGRFVKQSCDKRSNVFLQNRAQLSAADSVGWFCQEHNDKTAVGGLEPITARVVCACHENCASLGSVKTLGAQPQGHIDELKKSPTT